MRTINIKGKEYVPVNERVKEFRAKYPDHTVLTEIVSLESDSVVIKATVFNANGEAVANGYAQEDRGSSNINKTSYVENCETSAVGRALGMFGIGIDASMASGRGSKCDRPPGGYERESQGGEHSCITGKMFGEGV